MTATRSEKHTAMKSTRLLRFLFIIALLPLFAFGAANDLQFIQVDAAGIPRQRIVPAQSAVSTTLASYLSALGIGTEDTPNFSSLRLNGLTTNGLVTTTGGTGNFTVTSPGTGVLTALAVNVGTAGSFLVNGGALGTPANGTLTNASGLPISGINGLGAGVGTALAAAPNATGGFVTYNGNIGAASGTSLELTGNLTAPDVTLPSGSLVGNLNSRSTNQGIYLTGSSGGGVSIAPPGTTSFTAVASVNLPALSSEQVIYAGPPDSFYLSVMTNGTIKSSKTSVGGNNTSSSSITAGVTHHVAYVKTAPNAATYYIDAAVAGSITETFNDYSATGTLIGSAGFNNLTGIVSDLYFFNRALALGEIKSLVLTGKPARIDWPSIPAGTTATSGSLVIGIRYRITTFVAGDDFTNVGSASNASGVEFIATGTTPTVWANSSTLTVLGLIFAPDQREVGIGYQWHGTSQTGATKDDLTLQNGTLWALPSEQGSYVRATLTWAGTHEAKSLLGQVAIPPNAVITTIVTTASAGSAGAGLTVGSVTTPNLFVTANTYTTAKKVHTLATQLPAGTATNDLSLVLDPDDQNYTGTIQVSINYITAQ